MATKVAKFITGKFLKLKWPPFQILVCENRTNASFGRKKLLLQFAHFGL